MKVVFDIETNGLLPEMTVAHCLVLQDADTKRIYRYSDSTDRHPNIEDGLAVMKNAEVLIGHNIVGFDLPALKKLFDWVPAESTTIIDTWIMSLVLDYENSRLPRGAFNRTKHGLAAWGEVLGHSKQDNTDFQANGWSEYCEDMMKYCANDVALNTEVYEELMKMLQTQTNPKIRRGLRVEHDIAQFNADVYERGFRFDISQANNNLKIMEKHMKKIEAIIEPQLGTTEVLIDKTPKTAKYTKAGWYTATTARILSEWCGQEVLPEHAISAPVVAPGQPFQRVKVETVSLSNMELVKSWLMDQGWQPDDWNVTKQDGRWVRTGPKLTTTSLSKLGRLGTLIDRYYTLRNRVSVIQGWLEKAEDGRVHGNMWCIGTPSFRARHEVIVNLPKTSAQYGRMVRELFIADSGRVLVGADSAGNQLRGLCHYVGDNDYTDLVINGDQHTRNAEVLGCSRSVAKSFLYAILFGAGDAKLGQVLTGVSNAKVGREARSKFMANLPGFGKLVSRLKDIYKQYGCIPGLDGRKVYVRSDYQCLNYLLQAAEGVTCKAAVAYAMKKIRDEGIDAEPRLFYHDEVLFDCDPVDAPRLGEILTESFREAPKDFGVECMDGGEYVIGSNYSQVH